MKIFLCLLLIKVCSCADSEQQSSNYWRGIAYDDGNYASVSFPPFIQSLQHTWNSSPSSITPIWSEDTHFSIEDEQLNVLFLKFMHRPRSPGYQQRGPIERPCSLQDLNCIRQYFAHNSRCSAVHGPAPDPQRIKVIPMSVPHANITFVLYETEVKGVNDFKIKEFYINKQTDRLVLEVEFRKLFLYAPYTVITFHRKGMEPIEISDYAFIEYKDLSLTLIAPHIRDIKLSEGHVYSYINDNNPRRGLGPNYTESKDPQVQLAAKRFIEKIGLSLQEAFITQGPILMSAFLQNSVCSY